MKQRKHMLTIQEGSTIQGGAVVASSAIALSSLVIVVYQELLRGYRLTTAIDQVGLVRMPGSNK